MYNKTQQSICLFFFYYICPSSRERHKAVYDGEEEKEEEWPLENSVTGLRGNFLITITNPGGEWRSVYCVQYAVQGDCTGRALPVSAVWCLSRIVDSDGDRSHLLDTQIMSSNAVVPPGAGPPACLPPPVLPPLPQRSPGQSPGNSFLPPRLGRLLIINCVVIVHRNREISLNTKYGILMIACFLIDTTQSPGHKHGLLAPETLACISPAKHPS